MSDPLDATLDAVARATARELLALPGWPRLAGRIAAALNTAGISDDLSTWVALIALGIGSMRTREGVRPEVVRYLADVLYEALAAPRSASGDLVLPGPRRTQ